MKEIIAKGVQNCFSTKFFLALYTGALATWQFQNSPKTTADWIAYLGFLTGIATGHGIARVIEKKNGNKNNSANPPTI